MSPEDKERMVQELMKKPNIQELYDIYIIKDMSFEEWVRLSLDRALAPRPEFDATKILYDLMKGE